MPGPDGRKVSRQDIQFVQNLIERCLQLYMNRREVVHTLSTNAKVEPGFTELVWQKLEEENHDFFKAYRVRLMLKDQISIFNRLLEKQVELMHKVCPSGVASVPLSNGFNNSSLHQIPSFYISDHASMSSGPVNVLCNGGSSVSIIDGGPSGHQNIQLCPDASLTSGKMDASACMLSTQNSHMEGLHGMDVLPIKSEHSYSSNSEFEICTDSRYLDAHPIIEDAVGASFSSSGLTGQQLNEPLLDIDTSSIGFLSQIPRNFSFSDLSDDFSHSTVILESYGRSPFLAPEAINFMDSPEGDYKEAENRRLDTISEGISFEDFGSD